MENQSVIQTGKYGSDPLSAKLTGGVLCDSCATTDGLPHFICRDLELHHRGSLRLIENSASVLDLVAVIRNICSGGRSSRAQSGKL